MSEQKQPREDEDGASAMSEDAKRWALKRFIALRDEPVSAFHLEAPTKKKRIQKKLNQQQMHFILTEEWGTKGFGSQPPKLNTLVSWERKFAAHIKLDPDGLTHVRWSAAGRPHSIRDTDAVVAVVKQWIISECQKQRAPSIEKSEEVLLEEMKKAATRDGRIADNVVLPSRETVLRVYEQHGIRSFLVQVKAARRIYSESCWRNVPSIIFELKQVKHSSHSVHDCLD